MDAVRGLDELVERCARALRVGADSPPALSAWLEERAADIAAAAEVMADRPCRAEALARARELAGYARTVEALVLSPGIPQRTDAWYAARETMVTGSELADATDPSRMRRFFERKLAGPGAWNDLKDNPAIKWGVKYEPVACELYERRSGCRVHEFGLLPHPTIPSFGASPDGISDLGIMLEIKCPYSRVITGQVPPSYYAQVQAQLDTTGLRECDFLECKLEEYADAGEFEADSHPGDPSLTKGGLEKGGVWQHGDAHEVCVGRDAPGWAADRPGASLWRLVVYSRVRVLKDDSFMKNLRGGIDLAAARIARYREAPDELQRDFPPRQDPWKLKSFAFRV